ncbi:hypothetical protein HK101_006683 [Irineochytrium annulatum]|nr:hypothetical protein HK101_006683 [Irineochytrium annulatum]
MSLARYTSAYVRRIARDAILRARVASFLSRGVAFEDPDALAVAMIDISGYSKMAADLTFLGKMASEVITKSVGAYSNKANRHANETFDLVVLRAVACCVTVITRCAPMDLDMSLAEASTALPAGENTPARPSTGTGELGLTSDVLVQLGILLGRSTVITREVEVTNYTVFSEHALSTLAQNVFTADMQEINYMKEDEIVRRYNSKWDTRYVLPENHRQIFQREEEESAFIHLFVNQSVPFAHVNNADQCVQSMRFFVKDLRESIGVADIAISIATGELLFTAIGNSSRAEAGLLARLASVAKKTHRLFLMDEETYEHVKLHNDTEDLGSVEVTGRTDKLHTFGLRQTDKSQVAAVFGYENERALIKSKFVNWQSMATRTVIVIEAGSGLGKSSLANFLMDEAVLVTIPVA